MQLEEIKKAKDFLRGDLNIIQWGLKKGYYISLYDSESDDLIEKSQSYEDLKKFLENRYQVELQFKKKIEDKFFNCGWVLLILINDDEDIVSDYSCSKNLDEWAKEFEQLHEQLNN